MKMMGFILGIGKKKRYVYIYTRKFFFFPNEVIEDNHKLDYILES